MARILRLESFLACIPSASSRRSGVAVLNYLQAHVLGIFACLQKRFGLRVLRLVISNDSTALMRPELADLVLVAAGTQGRHRLQASARRD